MRPAITILIFTILMLGIFSYTRFAESVRPSPPTFLIKKATGVYTLKVTRTFDCEQNEFGESLLVQFKNQVLLSRKDTVPASELLNIPPLDVVELGGNIIYVEANINADIDFDSFDDAPASFDANSEWEQPRAMKIEVFRDGNLLAEKTIWSSQGITKISDSIEFTARKIDLEKLDTPRPVSGQQ